jgi:hypothetical protein
MAGPHGSPAAAATPARNDGKRPARAAPRNEPRARAERRRDCTPSPQGIKITDSDSKKKVLRLLKAEQAARMMDADGPGAAAGKEKKKKKAGKAKASGGAKAKKKAADAPAAMEG